jgi:uncharacterized protein YqeY
VKITRKQLRQIITEADGSYRSGSRPIRNFGSNTQRKEMIKEANDSDMLRIIDNLVNKFYDVAYDYEQYQPIQYRNLSEEERYIIDTFEPEEFVIDSADRANTGLEVNLSREHILELEAWLENKLEDDWKQGRGQ